MFKRKLAPVMAFGLVLMACRLPYVVGQQLSPLANQGSQAAPATAAVFTPVGIYPMTTVDLDLYPGVTAPGVTPGAATGAYPYPGLGALQPGGPGAVYPGAGQLLPTSTALGGYPAPPVGPNLPGATSGATYPGASPGATAPFAPQAVPATQVPSPTAFLTPTPTITPSPTPTNTALPPPAWIRAPLRSTDPTGVRLAAGKVQLIEFFAYWSGPSQAMAPIVQGVEAEFAGRANFVYLDIDNPAVDDFADELGFEREPHFFLLAPDGRVLKEWSGPVSLDELRGALSAALNDISR